MIHIINVLYIGCSIDMIEVIDSSDDFHLMAILVPYGRMDGLIRLFCDQVGICPIIVKNANHLHEVITSYADTVECCIMYYCYIIIKQKTLNIMRIFNVHPGSLSYNRGDTPIEYALLHNHPFLSVSLHMINDKIDLGTLIQTYPIQICIRDTFDTIEKKVHQIFPCVLSDIKHYLLNPSGTIVSDGQYNRKLTLDDMVIDFSEDSVLTIYNKVRTMKASIFIDGSCIRLTGLLSISMVDDSNIPQASIYGDTFLLMKDGLLLTMLFEKDE